MKRIILIDDNIDACQSAIKALEQEFEVIKCRDIITAKRRIMIGSYALVIIDLMMPTRGLANGDEFTAGINFFDENVKGKFSCPILFWTNLSDNSLKAYLEEHPSSDVFYLYKNDSSQQLIDKVHEIIK